MNDREAFEACPDLRDCDFSRCPDGTARGIVVYNDPWTQGAWQGWQAALAHARSAEPVAWMVINESGQDVYVTADPKLAATGQRALPLYTGPVTERQCTCCPDDTPPVPCPRKYALSECLAAAQSAEPVAVVPANIGDQSGCIRWLIDEQLPVGTLLYAAPPVQSAEPVAWSDLIEQRLLTWRQRFVNMNGDQLALDDFMDKRSMEDLIDFVCAAPPAAQTEPAALFAEAREALHELGCHPDIPGWIADKCIEIADRMRAAPHAVHPAPGYCPHCKQYTIEEPLAADDEAVRLLRKARYMCDDSDTFTRMALAKAIDAYLARVTK